MKIRIEITGYGSEIVIGRVPILFYNIFEDEGLSFEDYAWEDDYFDSNEDVDIPENIRPFEPGCWFDAGDIAHEWGPSTDDSYVTIYQDDDIVINNLNLATLEMRGALLNTTEEIYPEDIFKNNEAYFIISNVEKGLFYSYEFEIDNFDLNKLTIDSIDVDGMVIISAVSYDGEELVDLGESGTDTKSSEATLYIIEGDD